MEITEDYEVVKMSNWTHVSGILRTTYLRYGEIDFDKEIGREYSWDSDDEILDEAMMHPERFMPAGSNGTLHKTVLDNTNGGSLVAYVVSVFGDLRDHDNPLEIIEWFKRLCDSFCVQDAAIAVHNEQNGLHSWSYAYGFGSRRAYEESGAVYSR